MERRIFKHLLFAALFLAAHPALFAKARKAAAPEWVLDFKKVYPSEKYIGYASDAESQEEAREKCLSLVANYFQTAVKSVSASRVEMLESSNASGSAFQKSRAMVQEVSVKSDAELFALEWQLYFDEKSQRHYCAAIIEREAASNTLLQRMENEKGEFTEFYTLAKALEAHDAIGAIRRYSRSIRAADEYLRLADYLSIISPGSKISPELAQKMAGAKGRVSALAAKSTLAVWTSGEGAVFSAVKSAFAGEGFALGAFGDEAAYILQIEYDAHIKEDGGLFSATPEVSVSISNGEGAAFSYTKVLDRMKAFRKETLEKQAETKVISELQETLIKEFYGES